MDKIEKIRQEIERRKQSLRAGICNPDVFTKKQKSEMLVASEELDRLNRFLDTLAEEPDKSLEEEMNRFIDAHYHTRFDETLENGNDPLTVFDFEDIARHFYELGLRRAAEMYDEIEYNRQRAEEESE